MAAVNIERRCPICKELKTLTVSEDGLIAWQSGMKVQEAFPGLTPGQREFLLTGICDPCWDKLFK